MKKIWIIFALLTTLTTSCVTRRVNVYDNRPGGYYGYGYNNGYSHHHHHHEHGYGRRW